MSGIFSGAGGAQAPPPKAKKKPSRRPRALLPTLAIVVALVVLFSIFVQVWTSKMWYSAFGFGGVYTEVLVTRIVLFIVLGVVFAGVIMGNVYLAYRIRPILIADGYRNTTLERYQDAIDPFKRWLFIGIGFIIFLFAGASGSGHWKTYMLWQNGVPFGKGDVYFHKDIGFYIFDYPWYRYLLTYGFVLVFLAFVAAVIAHYLYGGIRLQVKNDRFSAGAQKQLSVLIGVFILLKAVAYWMDKYGAVLSGGDLISGITYTDAHAVLPSKNILSIIALICAALFFANLVRPGWLLPLIGLGSLVVAALLIGAIWPLIVQQLQVEPSESDKEAPYIAMNIKATRDAYNLSDISTVSYPGTTDRSPQQIKKLAEDMPSVRVIDPRLVSPAFENLQQMRGFYTFPDVLDVDRYSFNGSTKQDVVVAARELNLGGLKQSQQNWINTHTVYTHGYGVVAAYGAKRAPNGDPVWAESGLPTKGEFGDYRQQIYFGESEPKYSIVGAPKGTPPVELNIPRVGDKGSDQNSTYHGDGGVPIGSTFRRVLYAAKFWDSSILLSGRVNDESRIIYDRSPRKMAEKVAPWLTIDGNAYPAIVNGQVKWVLDGYTTTSHYPMSEIIDLNKATKSKMTQRGAVAGHRSHNINYIRNSVKITVDAYDGTVTLYQWNTHDPVLKAWMNVFPGVVQPKSAIPDGLMAHLRYPVDMFKVQRKILTTYHVTDPHTFYNGSENWKIPQDPVSGGSFQAPYYLTVKLPNGDKPHFALSTVYVPRNRQNLASFVTVNAEASSDDYGHIKVFELPSDNTVPGPGQMQNVLNNDSDVRQKLLPFNQQETQVLRGNLLTLPLAGEMLYAQPVYTKRGGPGSYPILQYVTVSLNQKVGIGRTFEEALDRAIGLKTKPAEKEQQGQQEQPPPDQKENTKPPGEKSVEQQVTTYLDKAEAAYEKGQQALSDHDLAGYQNAIDEMHKWLDKARDLRQSNNLEGGNSQGNSGSNGSNGSNEGGG